MAILLIATVRPVRAQTPQPKDELSSAPLPSFEVATIKLDDPKGPGVVGFYSYPGGRVFVGAATIQMLIAYAFDVQDFQIAGVPDWAGHTRFDIVALPPETSESRTAIQPPIKATPSIEQRRMLQSLLRDRFGLKFHMASHEGSVLLLTLKGKSPELKDAKDKTRDPRGGVFLKAGGVADGEAAGTNVTMTFLARQLSRDMGRPVIDQTGLSGSYDFHVPPSDPTNHDIVAASLEAMDRIGLRLKAGRGPVEQIVIDTVTRPTEN